MEAIHYVKFTQMTTNNVILIQTNPHRQNMAALCPWKKNSKIWQSEKSSAGDRIVGELEQTDPFPDPGLRKSVDNLFLRGSHAIWTFFFHLGQFFSCTSHAMPSPRPGRGRPLVCHSQLKVNHGCVVCLQFERSSQLKSKITWNERAIMH